MGTQPRDDDDRDSGDKAITCFHDFLTARLWVQ